MGYGAEIVNTVSAWEGISAHPHRFGGTEFRLGNVEIGHIHGNHMADLPFTRKIREALVTDGESSVHHLLPETGWISFYLRRDEDVAQAIRLFRMSYLQKRLRRAKDETKQAILDELTALNASHDLKMALGGATADIEE
ncbi:MAG: DUF5519 family protein [bacterium]|nr:DUF5519 family protein [bacterium]